MSKRLLLERDIPSLQNIQDQNFYRLVMSTSTNQSIEIFPTISIVCIILSRFELIQLNESKHTAIVIAKLEGSHIGIAEFCLVQNMNKN